jgi:thioredoxin-related protein
MKKQLLFLSLIAGVLMASCSKSKDDVQVTVAAKFTFNGTAYTSKGIAVISSPQFSAITDSAIADDNSKKILINFLFKKDAIKDGNYNILATDANTNVTEFKATDVALLIGEISLSNKENTGIYSSNSTGTLVLSNTSGKISIKMPAVKTTGTYYDNTDPHNTQIINQTPTLSATTFVQQ